MLGKTKRNSSARPTMSGISVRHQLAILLVELGLDVVALDGHLDVLLAGPDVLELDGLLELFRLVAIENRGVARLGHGRGLLGGGFVRHPSLPQKSRKP